jgi:signal transduction histidine kinase
MADDLLQEVFANLIGNSIKFGEPGVEVRVRVEKGDSTVGVSVEDTGPGVPDAVKPILFTRFARGTNARSGKGLGLYITRTLIERYGGRVWVEDRVPGRPEGGAAFRFTLLRSDRTRVPPVSPAPEAADRTITARP